ncbi:hypothetical protein LSCM1_04083 [Leishmania martiniquensis]|uniref:Uncharacterized protein n=1 Tax=Leishmania martiniquensis TaxID=1580590 RepID=A0A836HGF0_9TRYP|nr:hypothetical protein LSCM1_04083 [Leishmania martiniquensis]
MRNVQCPDGPSSERSSTSFIMFEIFFAFTLAVSTFFVYRFRRQAESRAQQRYDRLDRVEGGAGSCNIPAN